MTIIKLHRNLQNVHLMRFPCANYLVERTRNRVASHQKMHDGIFIRDGLKCNVNEMYLWMRGSKFDNFSGFFD